MRSLRIRYPNDCVWKVYLVLLHRHEFLVDPKTGFRDDPHDIPQVRRGVYFNSSLLGPANIVWPKQTLHTNGEFDSGAWVSRKQLFPHGNVQHPPEDAKFLVDRSRLQNSFLSVSEGTLDSNSLTETISQVVFYVVGGEGRQTDRRKGTFKVFHGA